MIEGHISHSDSCIPIQKQVGLKPDPADTKKV